MSKSNRWGSNIMRWGLTEAVIISNLKSPSEADDGEEKRWDRRCTFSDDGRVTDVAAEVRVVRFPMRAARAVIRVGNVTARLSEDEASRMELLLLDRPTISYNSKRCPNNLRDDDNGNASPRTTIAVRNTTIADAAAAAAVGNTASRLCNRRRVILPIYSYVLHRLLDSFI
jgi:hypothetical protein